MADRWNTIFEVGYAQDEIRRATHTTITAERFDRHWSQRFGASIVNTDDVYGTLDAGIRMQIPGFGPYIGAGLFFGRNFQCALSNLDSEQCADGTTIGLYPETGINVWPMKNIRLSMYARYYYALEKDLGEYSMIGIALGFK
jgi:hypothetical protein